MWGEGRLWKQPGSRPPPPLSGGDTGKAISRLSDSFSSSGKMGKMPTSWDYWQESLMTLTVIMAKGSGIEIVTRHPTKTAALNACLDPVQEALLLSSVYTSVT